MTIYWTQATCTQIFAKQYLLFSKFNFTMKGASDEDNILNFFLAMIHTITTQNQPYLSPPSGLSLHLSLFWPFSLCQHRLKIILGGTWFMMLTKIQNCQFWEFLEWETTVYFWTFLGRLKILLNPLTYCAMLVHGKYSHNLHLHICCPNIAFIIWGFGWRVKTSESLQVSERQILRFAHLPKGHKVAVINLSLIHISEPTSPY